MTDTPAAFLSYVRDDDFHDDQFITRFRRRLEEEVKRQGIKGFSIFQDRFDVEGGQEWARRINEALAEATLLIPVITPGFFQSPFCRDEVELFAEYEEKRKRRDRIVPIYYIKTPEMEAKSPPSDPIVQIIRKHNHDDWRELRNHNFDQKLKNRIARLAGQIVERLRAGSVTAEKPAGERVRVLNPPPDFVPAEFQDRRDLLSDLLDRIERSSSPVIVLQGDDGLGKTAVAARILPELRNQSTPVVDVFDYFSAIGHRPVNAATVIDDLARAHPDENVRSRLSERLNPGRQSWMTRLDKVLAALADVRVLVVIDSAEELLDEVTGAFLNTGLSDLIQDLCRRDDHSVRLLLVTTRPPAPLFRGHGGDPPLVLDDGLPPEDMAHFLANLGAVDLAPPGPVRDRLHERTRGRPRTLELLYAALAGEPGIALSDLLDTLQDTTADQVSNELLKRLNGQLSGHEVLVLRAAAIFGRPVPVSAMSWILDPYLPKSAVLPSVERLAQRRILRRDGDRYYLPPSEADHIRAQIDRGVPEDRDRTPSPQTRVALLHRAAEYFHAEAARTVVTRVEHLSPHFSEVDLRVKAGEYDRALQAMNDLDDAYLEGWGHSDALTQWRKIVGPKLSNPNDRILNLERMAWARRQQDELDDQIKLLQQALRKNSEIGDENADYDLDLRIDLSGAYWDNWRVGKAYQEYTYCLDRAKDLRSAVNEAMAHTGLGLCLVDMGAFAAADEHYSAGLEIARRFRHEDDLRVTEAELLFDRGMLLLYQGLAVDAIDSFDESRSIAERLDDVLLAAQVMDAHALALLHFGRADEALELATLAVNIGMQSGMAEVSHAATQTLARIHLSTGDIEAAASAANAGARIPRGRWAIETLALQGIAEHRRQPKGNAIAHFRDAQAKVSEVLRREKKVYKVHELHGLVLTGLALCGKSEYLPRAEKAFRAARDITRDAGAVWQCLQLFNALTKGASPTLLEGLLNAAMGRRTPTTPR